MKGDTQKIRDALIKLGRGGEEITNAQLATVLDMVFNNEKQKLYRILRDFIKSGEIEKLDRGVYKYIGKTGKTQLQQIMWRAMRAQKTVTIDDIVSIAGASREYTKSWLRMLAKREIIKRIRIGNKWKYQLINDPIIMPINEDQIALRMLRRQKKRQAIAALEVAKTAIKKAKEAIKNCD